MTWTDVAEVQRRANCPACAGLTEYHTHDDDTKPAHGPSPSLEERYREALVNIRDFAAKNAPPDRGGEGENPEPWETFWVLANYALNDDAREVVHGPSPGPSREDVLLDALTEEQMYVAHLMEAMERIVTVGDRSDAHPDVDLVGIAREAIATIKAVSDAGTDA